MPVNGHLPSLSHQFGLNICTPCRAGDHRSCRSVWNRRKRRLDVCECLGPVDPTTPSCLPEP